MSRVHSVLGCLSICALLLGCATIQNDPVNIPGTPSNLANRLGPAFEEDTSADQTIIGLSFSGGGTRAAAYAYGVLSDIKQHPKHNAQKPKNNQNEYISGVSGGSVTAAYYGLTKRAG